jgi:hypothetical protein
MTPGSQPEESGPELIRRRNWLQGCVISPGDLQLLDQHTGSQDESRCAIMLTHSCDLLARSYNAEPCVEVIPARPVDRRDSRYEMQRNPRRLDLPLRVNGVERYHELRAGDRLTLARQPFERLDPDPERLLEPLYVRRLVQWIVNRYDRDAFPDAFNARLLPAHRHLETLLEKEGAPVNAIYAQLSDTRELPPDTEYGLTLVIAMDTTLWAAARRQEVEQRLARPLAKLLDTCDGISVDDFEVKPNSQITLDDIGFYLRLDTIEFSPAD